jgi:pimeloyl-ACP methyl ester carboxylesterase
MGNGAHLVGHSYGGLGVLFAAARRLDATLSLTLLEPGAFGLAQHHPAARALVADVRRLWDQDLPDEAWVVRFLKAVGSDPDALSPELIADAVSLVPVFRRGRPMWEGEPPLAELASAAFPKLVVSGGIAQDSTPSATTSLNGSVRLARSSRAPAMRSSSPGRPSMRRCSPCGAPPRRIQQARRLPLYDSAAVCRNRQSIWSCHAIATLFLRFVPCVRICFRVRHGLGSCGPDGCNGSDYTSHSRCSTGSP